MLSPTHSAWVQQYDIRIVSSIIHLQQASSQQLSNSSVTCHTSKNLRLLSVGNDAQRRFFSASDPFLMGILGKKWIILLWLFQASWNRTFLGGHAPKPHSSHSVGAYPTKNAYMYYALAGAITVLLSKSIFIQQGSLGWCKFSKCLFLGLDFALWPFYFFFFVFESLAQVPCYKLLTILACSSWSWDYFIGTGHACASLPLVHTASNMGQHTCISQYNPHARLVRCYCKIFKMLIDVVTLSLYFYCFFLEHFSMWSFYKRFSFFRWKWFHWTIWRKGG